jgi:hypothetical protein
MYDYVSNRILVDRNQLNTPEALAEVLTHEAQHHIDDLSAAEGAGLLLTGRLDDRMYDNEVHAFQAGAHMSLELLKARDGMGYLDTLVPGGNSRVHVPEQVRPILEALTDSRAYDPVHQRVRSDSEMRAELESADYVSLL